MKKLKCVYVNSQFATSFTLDKIYEANSNTSDFAIGDNFCDPGETAWELEIDGLTVRSCCCDDLSPIIAKFADLK